MDLRTKLDELGGRIGDVEGNVVGSRPEKIKQYKKELEMDIRKSRMIMQDLQTHINNLESQMLFALRQAENNESD